MSGLVRMLATGLAAAVVASPLAAQDLRRRIEAGPDGAVAVTFPSRPDVCGSGTNLLRIGGGTFGDASWIWSRNDGDGMPPCERGPIRTLISRADGAVVAIRIAIGTVEWPSQTTDLGTVTGAAAGDYFLDLAKRVDGRLGRDALLAAALAEGAPTVTGFVEIARGPTFSRGLRESALSWLGRELSGGNGAPAIAATLQSIARDPSQPSSVRSRAVGALARADGRGVDDLVALARAEEPAVARAALAGLARSAQPKAREALRRAARDSSLVEPVRIEAIRALGGRDGTPADLAALRDLWPTLPGGQGRDVILELVAEAGGADNLRWLLGIARDAHQIATVRGRAVRAAEQAGAGSSELIKLFDDNADRALRRSVLESIGRIGDRVAFEKILTIAKADTDPEIRRSAVGWLARSGDPRARAALAEMVDR